MNATFNKPKPKKRRYHLKMKHVTVRGDVYYFRIAVPKHLQGTDRFGTRKHFWESLEVKVTDENAEAIVLGEVLALREKYAVMFGKQHKPSDKDFDVTAFIALAKSFLGVNYAPATKAASAQEYVEMMAGPVEKLEKIANPSETIVAIVSGGIALPALTMSQALNRYKELSSEKFGLNSDKRARDKKWRPFAQAVDEWNKAMGKNHDVTKLKNADTWAFKEELVRMIDAKRFDLASARKKIMWLRLITEKVLMVDYGIPTSPFEKVVIEGKAKKGKRPGFTNEECKAVLDRIVNGKSSDDLKALNVISSMTGATCKELCLLTKDDIYLNETIPYISIRPNEWRDSVKGQDADGDRVRDIPVFGAALEWLKKFPDGFERYRRHNGSEALSASSNKIIGEVAEGKTFYSYRHRLATALRGSKCGDNLKNSIMGHSSRGFEMHYGETFPLENKLEALMKALAETPEQDVQKKAA
jgi:hypothetical protein